MKPCHQCGLFTANQNQFCNSCIRQLKIDGQHPSWHADKDYKNCEICNTEFGVFTRHHHCRNCGKNVCDGCSKHTFGIGAYASEQRVCKNCHDDLKNHRDKHIQEQQQQQQQQQISIIQAAVREFISRKDLAHFQSGLKLVDSPYETIPYIFVRKCHDYKMYVYSRYDDCVTHCAITNDNKVVSCSSGDTSLKIWDPKKVWDPQEDYNCVKTLRGHTNGITHCAVTQDNKIVSFSDDHTLRIWDPQKDYNCVKTLHTNRVIDCAITHDNKIVSYSRDNTLRIWDPQKDYECVIIVSEIYRRINHLAVTQDNKIVICLEDKTLNVWDPHSRHVEELSGHSCHVNYCAVTQDNKIVSCSWDTTLRVWDPQKGYNCVKTLSGHSCRVNYCAVTQDNKIVSCSDDGTLKIWDPQEDYNCVKTLHTNSKIPCAVTQDNKIVSCSYDGTLKIWDPKKGYNFVATLVQNSDPLTHCAVTQDNKIIICTRRGTVGFYEAVPRSSNNPSHLLFLSENEHRDAINNQHRAIATSMMNNMQHQKLAKTPHCNDTFPGSALPKNRKLPTFQTDTGGLVSTVFHRDPLQIEDLVITLLQNTHANHPPSVKHRLVIAADNICNLITSKKNKITITRPHVQGNYLTAHNRPSPTKLRGLDLSREYYLKIRENAWNSESPFMGWRSFIKELVKISDFENFMRDLIETNQSDEKMPLPIFQSKSTGDYWVFAFHGTTSAEAIYQPGFKYSLSGSIHGSLYGKGLYLAINPNESTQYVGGDLISGTLLICAANLGSNPVFLTHGRSSYDEFIRQGGKNECTARIAVPTAIVDTNDETPQYHYELISPTPPMILFAINTTMP